MDIKEKCEYLNRKYWKFVPFSIWEWVGENIHLYDDTYFERYKHIQKVRNELYEGFEKVRVKYGYDTIDEMLEKEK